MGTANNNDSEIITGTIGADKIEGLGGNDTINASDLNDVIYAGSESNPNSSGAAVLSGDGGNDTIYGGAEFNILTGSNSSLLGADEIDTLIGNSFAQNIFILGDNNGCFYATGNDGDYANISSFSPGIDAIQLSGSADDYGIVYTNGVNLLYRLSSNAPDLIAKINGLNSSLNLGVDFSFVGV